MTKLFNKKFNFFNRTFAFAALKTPKYPVSGYTTRCDDGKHCFFADYDLVDKKVVLIDIMHLFSRGLSHVLLFETFSEKRDDGSEVGNYHLISFDKLYFVELYELLGELNIDPIWRKLALKSYFRAWVLRFSEKGKRSAPKFVKCYVNFQKQNMLRDQSFGHLCLVSLFFPEILNEVRAIPNLFWDDSETIYITEYNTLSKTTIEEVQKNG